MSYLLNIGYRKINTVVILPPSLISDTLNV